MFPTCLLTTLFLALDVAANPILVNWSPISVPLSRQSNFTSTNNLLKHDQACAKALEAVKTGSVFQLHDINSPIENQTTAYIALVGVGSPPTYCNMFLHCRSKSLAENPFMTPSSSTLEGLFSCFMLQFNTDDLHQVQTLGLMVESECLQQSWRFGCWCWSWHMRFLRQNVCSLCRIQVHDIWFCNDNLRNRIPGPGYYWLLFVISNQSISVASTVRIFFSLHLPIQLNIFLQSTSFSSFDGVLG